MKLRLFLLLIAFSAGLYFVFFGGPRHFRAQAQKAQPTACCGAQHPIAPREVDFPYYNLTNGWVSTLNLVSASPQPLDFTLAIKAKLGQVLTTAQTIQPRAKLAIDLASLITQLGGDPTGAFAEGSVAVYLNGTIMPLVGQITISNPQLSLVHESVMVEHDPGRSDIPAALNGLWWGLAGREGRVMVSNTSASPQTAQVYLDFQGQRHSLNTPLTFQPYETKTLEIAELLASLGVAPAQAPEGGITIIQNGPQPALIANGRITDAATGFSSTIDFPWAAMQESTVSALHASGLPIGTPTADSPFAGAGMFVPHVVVRNLTSSAQTVTITVEYPQPAAAGGTSPSQAESPATASAPKNFIPPPPVPGDPHHHPEWGAGTGSTVGALTLGPFPVGAYTSVDFSLAAALAQLPLPLPYCSVRIQYSGMPGSVQAQVTSVESNSNLIVDSHVQSEGNGWAGSGANPWHLDENTESILFLTNESDKPARIGFSVTANNVHYYLTELRLNPHETRVIDLRKLRDAQLPDFKKNLIPASATDGSVHWIRLDNVPVMGRLMTINRQQGMASNYDCCVCPCAMSYYPAADYVSPGSSNLLVGGSVGLVYYGGYLDCNGITWDYKVNAGASWISAQPSIATVSSSGTVTGQSGGTTSITGYYSNDWYYYNPYLSPFCFVGGTNSGSASGQVNVVTVSVSCSPTNLALGSTAPSSTTTGNCNTTASPAGGTFSWSVNKTTVTLSPSGGGASYTAASQSTASGDTIITVKYTVGNQTASAQSAGITVHNPTSLSVNSDTTNASGQSCNVPCLANPGGGTCNASTSSCGYSSYFRQRQYSVLDQFGNKFENVGLSSVNVTESVPYTSTCPNVSPQSGSYNASPFTDSYYLCSTCCLPQGPGCSIQTNPQQTIYANSVNVRTETITWGCTSVTVSP